MSNQPVNPMVDPVDSVEPPPVGSVGPPPVGSFVPPPKRSGRSLKPVKTTRNMNPSSGNTMKYVDKDFLDHTEGIVVKKGVSTRSSIKTGDLGSAVDDMDIVNEVVVEKGDKNVSVHSGEDTEMFWGSNGDGDKGSSTSLGVKDVKENMNIDEAKGVSDTSVKSKKVNVVKNIVRNLDKGGQNLASDKSSPMPVPFAENPVFNPKVNNGSKPRSPPKVSFSEEKRPGMFKVDTVDANKGIKSVSNFEVGEGSGVKDEQMKDSNGSNEKKFSFANVVTGEKGIGNNKLRYIDGMVNSKGKKVVDMDPVVVEGSSKWSRTLIGHFVGFQMPHRELLGNLRRMWRQFHFKDVMMNNSGLYFCNFDSIDGMQAVVESGPWLVDNKPFYVQKWEPGICMSKPELTKVSVWAKIFNVPLEAWNVEGISRIASRIGAPIIMDRITTEMCEKTYGRASFARVMVEVDSSKDLVYEVEIYYKSLERSMILEVEYPWKPPVCEHCKVFGHTIKSCQAKVGEVASNVTNAARVTRNINVDNMNGDGWRDVVNRRGGYSRGGFSNAGRGSFGGGRGNAGSNGGRGSGVARQYVPATKNAQPSVSVKQVVQETKVEKVNPVNEAKKKEEVSSAKKPSLNGNPKSNSVIKEVATGNRFKALGVDETNKENEKWKKFCMRIDILCNEGFVISKEEKSKWSAREMEYFLSKENSMKVDANSQDSILKSKIESLQDRIVAANDGLHENATRIAKKRIVDECGGKENNVAYTKFYEQAIKKETDKVNMMEWERDKLKVDLFVYLGTPLTDEVKATWSEDMLEYYNDALENIYNDRINGHYNDVEGVSNATAEFVSKDEVSNIHDVTMAEMQGGVAADSSSFQ